jgi:hypothetical protein
MFYDHTAFAKNSELWEQRQARILNSKFSQNASNFFPIASSDYLKSKRQSRR